MIIQATSQLPPLFSASEDERLTVVTCGNHFVFLGPGQSDKRQDIEFDNVHGSRAVLGVCDVDGRVMGSEGKNIARGGERDGMHPTSSWGGIFGTNSIEREFLTPDGRGGTAHQLERNKK